MKNYETPELIVIVCESQDIVTTSNLDNIGGAMWE